MKPETISTITMLLNNAVAEKERIMMNYINGGFERDLDKAIKEYQKVYKARNDFRDWLDEQEENGGKK